MVRWLALGAALLVSGCSSSLAEIIHGPPPLPNALLTAWLRPFDDLQATKASVFCADFTPAVAARIAASEHAATCARGVRRLLRPGDGAEGPGVGAARTLLHELKMVDVVRAGDRATARLAIAGRPSGQRSRLRLIAGRWRVADQPTIQASSGCSKPAPPGCTAGAVALYFAP